MLLFEVPDANPSLTLIESCCTLVGIAFAFSFPLFASTQFRSVEIALGALARNRRLSVLTVFLAALLLRLAIIPFCPIPAPFVGDDFSFLLGADTLLHGRIANPTPVMWTHFETIHVTMFPTYSTMYFPGQSLVLAFGKLALGHPWYGLLFMSALMCAAICWMLQAWVPPSWALLGGFISVIHLGLFSYWINSYHSAGTIGAFGGALMLGGLRRGVTNGRIRDWMMLSVGVSTLILSRPYEGLLLSLPVCGYLCWWMLFGKNCPSLRTLMRQAVLPLSVVVVALGWLGYYDLKAFGKVSTLPYTLDRAQYAMAPYFVWQGARPEPVYRHEEIRRFYYEAEIEFFAKIHSLRGFLPQTLYKTGFTILFYAGVVLLPPLIMMRRVLLDRRTRFLVICTAVMVVGLTIQVFVIPHYVAAFTCVFYALGLQAMRHLRVWKPEGRPVGMFMVRSTFPILILMCAFRLGAGPLKLPMHEWPANKWNFRWYGPDHFGTERASIQDSLEKMPGKQLVLVRYSLKHNPIDEWVYNGADIDGSKVIWARDMDEAHNRELLAYYPDRQVWLVQPDSDTARMEPFGAAATSASTPLLASNSKEHSPDTRKP